VLWGEAAKRKAALSRLMPLGLFESDAPWDELPQAFMVMDAEQCGLLGTSRLVQCGQAMRAWRPPPEVRRPVGPGYSAGTSEGLAKAAAAHQAEWQGNGAVPLCGHWRRAGGAAAGGNPDPQAAGGRD
jgi:hypothetical protein